MEVLVHNVKQGTIYHQDHVHLSPKPSPTVTYTHPQQHAHPVSQDTTTTVDVCLVVCCVRSVRVVILVDVLHVLQQQPFSTRCA